MQNLGKYERQAWQAAEFADPTQRANLQLRYRNFILQLYNATPIDGYTWIHGIKGGRLVHVGSVDAPIALGEVKAGVGGAHAVHGSLLAAPAGPTAGRGRFHVVGDGGRS